MVENVYFKVSGTIKHRKNARDAGMDGDLAKPIEIQKLVETLAEILT